jgi:hypothetical protein
MRVRVRACMRVGVARVREEGKGERVCAMPKG